MIVKNNIAVFKLRKRLRSSDYNITEVDEKIVQRVPDRLSTENCGKKKFTD